MAFSHSNYVTILTDFNKKKVKIFANKQTKGKKNVKKNENRFGNCDQAHENSNTLNSNA